MVVKEVARVVLLEKFAQKRQHCFFFFEDDDDTDRPTLKRQVTTVADRFVAAK